MQSHAQAKFSVKGLAIVLTALVAGFSASANEVARVNERPITAQDLRSALGGLTEGQRDSVMRDSNSRRQILNSLIEQELLVSEAQKEKLDQDAEFKQALEAFRKQFLASRVLQKNLGTKFTDQAVKKYYETHKSRYSTDQVHAMHILVKDEQRAQELLKQARAKDVDFQALAEKNSVDPSAKNNRGDLGWFGRDRMVPEFTEAAFAGDKDQVVGPVKTTYGYHIIRIIDKKTGKPMEFDEVEVRVRNELRQDLTSAYVARLKQQAKIKVNDSVLDKL